MQSVLKSIAMQDMTATQDMAAMTARTTLKAKLQVCHLCTHGTAMGTPAAVFLLSRQPFRATSLRPLAHTSLWRGWDGGDGRGDCGARVCAGEGRWRG